MRVLGYIHTFNDEDVIERSLQALLHQTYVLEEVLLVDNASTDGTLQQSFPKQVTVIRHAENRGTSGAVVTGLQYALAKQYDWIWILDADSEPSEDALLKLVELYNSFPQELQEQTGILSSLCVCADIKKEVHGALLTPRGMKVARGEAQQPYYECDATIWSGSMYNLRAVREVGYPRFGLRGGWDGFGGMDWGDLEFGFRIKQAGYRVFVHRYSIFNHSIGEVARNRWFGSKAYTTHLPDRLYIRYRNMTFFWLYIHPNRQLMPVLLSIFRMLIKEIAKFCLTEKHPGPKIRACLQGAWHGFRTHLQGQYKA